MKPMMDRSTKRSTKEEKLVIGIQTTVDTRALFDCLCNHDMRGTANEFIVIVREACIKRGIDPDDYLRSLSEKETQ